MEWLKSIGILEYHASLVADVDRVDRFRDAIVAVVRPGDVVVDIGTGTGLLAYFACQAGAARVFAIEKGPIVDLARELALLNRFADRVEFFEGLSYHVELPERADVLITETLWNFGMGEGMAGFVADARRRMLKPGARIVPAAIDLHVVPVQEDRCYAMLHDRPPDRHGVDLSPLRHYQVNNVHMPHLDARGFLAEPALLVSTDLEASPAPDFDATVRVAATTDGVLHGTCGWFVARLAPGIELGNPPPSPRSSWAHAFLPLQNPVAVEPGDEIELRIATCDGGSAWRWRTTVRRADRVLAAYDQRSTDGFPDPWTGRGGRARKAPAATLEGEVAAWALGAIDGARTVAELEDEAVARFGARFAQPGDARAVVREVAGRYG